jgi:YidC/Oxa1 family membrane protein insertase
MSMQPGQRDPEQQKRLFLTLALVMGLMLAWNYFFAPPPPQPPTTSETPSPQAPAAPEARVGSGDVPAPGHEADAGQGTHSAPSSPPPEKTVAFQTKALDLAFTSVGGGVQRAILKNDDPDEWRDYKFEQIRGEKGVAPTLVNLALVKAGQSVPGASQLTGDVAMPFDTRFQLEERQNGVTFHAQTAEVALTKTFDFADSGHDLRARYSVTNRTQATKKIQLVIAYPTFFDPALLPKSSFFAPPPDQIQAIALTDGTVERQSVEKSSEEKTFVGPVQFVGFDQRYFLGALFPANGAQTQSRLFTAPDGRYEAQVIFDLGAVPPGETIHRDVGFFMGPKSLDLLNRVSDAAMRGVLSAKLPKQGEDGAAAGQGELVAQNPQLSEAIDFGWWAVLCRGLLFILKFFESLVHNWGVAIILLTVLVKLLLFPLSHKQMASMEAMRRIQPRIQELQKKYADDRESLGREQMKLFQENNVNPFGGCLPLIIQMPVWFALYRTLYSSFELYREPLIQGWITDLTQPDPFYLLPLAMGVTMFITQKMQPQMGDARQAKMMLYIMPIFFTFIMLNLPAGLTLYIFTNNLLSIAQQAFLRHRFQKKNPPPSDTTPSLPATKAASAKGG